MKKLSFLLLVFSFFSTTNAQIVNIPDAIFKTKLLEASTTNNLTAKDLAGNYFKIDANNDGQIQKSEALNVSYLRLDGVFDSTQISDLTGIQNFINLNGLDCSRNKLSSLNISSLVNLTYLDCRGNSLSSLDLSSLVNLTILDCSFNQLTTFDASSLVNLTHLLCYSNKIISLNISSLVNLKGLLCNNNSLNSLDISSFVNLIHLDCSFNQLTTLDASSLVNLVVLNCSSNKIISLNISSLVNLNSLDCSSNSLSSLNISSLVNLNSLFCGSNNLSSLDVSPLVKLKSLDYSDNNLTPTGFSSLVNLTYLDCRGNSLSSLDVSSLVNLNGLDCSNNSLNSLDISTLVNLTYLNYSYNSLNSLDISTLVNLTYLNCSYNSLNSLNVSSFVKLNTLNCSNNNLEFLNISSLVNLTDLRCVFNKLSSLDVSSLVKLEYLDCSNNNLSSLDVNNKTKLTYLNCVNNKLKSLFIKNGQNYLFVNFSNNLDLSYICCNESQLVNIQNKVTSLGYTNCVVNSYCSFVPGGTFYTIQGNQKLDSNKNGCDVNDIIMPNLKYNITNGSITGSFISNVSGNYSIPVQAGTHTISPVLENPTYFTVSPTTVNVTFPTQTSPFTQNFCIAANGVRPDLEVTLIPLVPARPGFDAKYKLVYKNKGNTTQSGAVNLTFNDAVLDLVVANPVASSQTTNNLSWNFTNFQPFETRELTFTMNVNSPMEIPALNNGDMLNFTTAITSSATDETPLDNTFTFNQTVVGSYDPNDKTCLEGSVITPALIGQYVHYLIRFENTGTFAAENVVIKDMIDLTKFDISTLVPTSASHSFVTKISDGNKVEFIFEKINLPFDDANNDGYIAFKIKTKPTLLVNDSFTNDANIYFDYNFPILTNKAISTFKALGTQDFDFSKYFTVYPNPAKSDLHITAKETINVKSISVYNTLGQLVLVITNADKVSKIDVSSLTAGNYFIQIKTDKGSSNARFVKE